MPSSKKLLLATHNKNKQKEMSFLLTNMGINVLGLEYFPEIGNITEDGLTLLENSLIKGRTVYSFTGLPTLADDTGLEVDALYGAPGVHSARYSGEKASYEDNVNKLLHELRNIPLELRTARFRTVISFINNANELYEEGIVEGRIAFEKKGEKGFGYDPIIIPDNFETTFSEMSQKDKNLISHRSRAINKMKKTLIKYFKNGESIE